MANSLTDLLKEMKTTKEPSEIVPVLLLLLSTQKEESYDTLANLSAIIDPSLLMPMLQLFEGCTITFPSVKDYRLIMLSLMVVYEKQLLNKTYSGVLDSLDEDEYKEVIECYDKLMRDSDITHLIKGLLKDAN